MEHSSRMPTLLQGSCLHDVTLQTVSPQVAHFCLSVERFITKELHCSLQGQHIIVALSGGADSTALFVVLWLLRHRMKISLSAVHIDHCLRETSGKEAECVHAFCQHLGVECALFQEPVAHIATVKRIGIEEAGRHARYARFAEVLQQYPQSWLVTGHHIDDLCEDVLMRLIRGSGWPALGGMAGFDAKRRILRPLLGTRRSTIEQVLLELQLVWIHDPSNDSLSYRRNRIRHSIMPLLLQENPAFQDNILSLWKLARIDSAYWEQRIKKIMHDTTIKKPIQEPKNAIAFFSHAVLGTLSQAERLRLYKKTLESIGQGQASAEKLVTLDNAWLTGQRGVQYQFAGKKSAHIQKNGISFTQIESR